MCPYSPARTAPPSPTRGAAVPPARPMHGQGGMGVTSHGGGRQGGHSCSPSSEPTNAVLAFLFFFFFLPFFFLPVFRVFFVLFFFETEVYGYMQIRSLNDLHKMFAHQRLKVFLTLPHPPKVVILLHYAPSHARPFGTAHAHTLHARVRRCTPSLGSHTRAGRAGGHARCRPPPPPNLRAGTAGTDFAPGPHEQRAPAAPGRAVRTPRPSRDGIPPPA